MSATRRDDFMMNRQFVGWAAVCLGWMGWVAASGAAAMTIAAGGTSRYAIVLPADAPKSVQAAAEELQRDIELATGAKLPLQKADAAGGGPVISLGATRQATAAGVTEQGLGDGAFRILTKGENLYILGPDTPDGWLTGRGGGSHGTANGVYTFLEDELGVRWLMPGEIGRDVPVRKRWDLGEIDRTFTPTFTWRQVTHLWDFASGAQAREIQKWTARQRQVSNPGFDHDHNWWRAINGGKTYGGSIDATVKTPAVKALYEAHPDWFAMDASGKRPYPRNHYAKLETTNPGLVRYFADLAIQALKANPQMQVFSLSPSDGRGWSQSPQSKALYDTTVTRDTDIATPGGRPGTSSLILKWYHDVAEIVAREYPQGRLSGYLYADYVAPPTKYAAKLPENFTPMICGVGTYGYGLYREENRQYFAQVMDAWAKVTPSVWYYYDLPNQLLRQHDDEIGSGSFYHGNFPGSTGIVTPAAPDILNFLFSTLVRDHIKGAYIYGVSSWSNAALGNYLLARMMWTPSLDAQAVQKEWLNRAYGPAAGAVMEGFYQKLNQWLGDYGRTHKDNCELLTLAMLKEVYAAHWDELERMLLEAKGQAMTDRQRQRLQLIEDNLIVLRWRLKNAGFLQGSTASTLDRNEAQVLALIGKQTDGFALFPGYVPNGNYPAPQPPKWAVRLETGKTAGNGGAVAGLDPNTFLIYAPKAMTVRIVPGRISQGAYFASYVLMDPAGKVLATGVFSIGTPVEFAARAGTPYYLFITPRKPVSYELTVEHAARAQGRLQGQTLVLSGPEAAVYVFNAPQAEPIGLFERASVVEIRKPFSGAAAAVYFVQGNYYADPKVLGSFDEGWRFSPDPADDGLKRGVTQPEFDDSAWKTISAMDWWQMQGFREYHGAAWYRIKFNLEQAPPPDGRRARLYFGAVDGNVEVYLNGKKVSERKLGPAPGYKGWNTPFSGDVTRSLKKGQNTLVVKVTSKDDQTASGIFKGVSLMSLIRTDKK